MEGDVDYVEFLRSKGVNVAGGNTMATVYASAADDEEDVAEVVPVQGHSTLANHIEQSTPIDSKEQQQAASNSKQQEQSTDEPRASNEQARDEPSKKPRKAMSKPEPETTHKQPIKELAPQMPAPIVPNTPKPISLHIMGVMKSGEATLEDNHPATVRRLGDDRPEPNTRARLLLLEDHSERTQRVYMCGIPTQT